MHIVDLWYNRISVVICFVDDVIREMICVLAATTLTVSSMLMPYLLLSSIQTPLRILILSLKALLKVFAACQILWNTLLLQLILCFLSSMVLLVKMVLFRFMLFGISIHKLLYTF
ncbi:uncharacterized protein LOC110709449 [Chenopodium quinoa]|uniref:uncharacterized protein LOC110709449 n=1 Tax=Chenopodium quinoa TaxID=63459 RepID=UPI000B77D8EB|nr:uncharacterized protein LOC110709449 [Chenopodium quinoa]XP_021743355.1 uncharacterized protein LOC110709449 [Chenopodium quinoa]